jgi:hypothetical protein
MTIVSSVEQIAQGSIEASVIDALEALSLGECRA